MLPNTKIPPTDPLVPGRRACTEYALGHHFGRFFNQIKSAPAQQEIKISIQTVLLRFRR
jgi:hypothetical protein